MKRLAIFLLVAGLPFPGSAQVPQERSDRPRGDRLQENARIDRPDPAAIMAQESDDLALILGLSAAQRPALEAFLGGRAPHRPDGPPPPGARPPSFEQQLAERRTQLTRRQAEELGRIDTAGRFYAQLDDRQKRVFEAVMRLRHSPGGPGGRPGPGPGPDHGEAFGAPGSRQPDDRGGQPG